MIDISWADFKLFITTRICSPQWFLKGNDYWLYAIDGAITVQCIIEKNNSDDHLDFENNFKSTFNLSISQVDTSKRLIVRSSITESGWSYLVLPIEIKTSQLNSLYSKNSQGTNYEVAQYFLKAGDVACVDQVDADSNCIKTTVTIALPYDFEMISGSLHQIEKPSTDIRVYIYGGAVDLGFAYCKEFVSGLNLKFIGADEQLKTDGRASKLMKYQQDGVPVPINKISFVVKHDAGIKHDIMFLLELYRL